MKSTKLIRILLQFDRYELNRLEKFVLSPYHNMNENISNLYIECKIAVISKEFPSEEELWSKINPDEYNSRKFRILTSLLLGIIQEFLAYEEFEKNPVHKATYLLQSVSNKKMEILYKSSIKSAKRLSDRQLNKSHDYYYYKYKLERLFYLLSGLEISRQKKVIDEKFNVEEIAQNLDIFYFGEKIKYQILLINLANLYEHDYELTFIDEILEHVKKHSYSEPSLKIYLQIYLTYIEPDKDKHYEKLYQLITEHLDIFPLDEANDVIEAAINYCIRRLNRGEMKYLREVFKVYQEAIENETIFQNGEIPPATFRNICTASFRLKEYAWAERFIHKYKEFLNEEFRENAVSLTMAQMYFYKSEYERVLTELQNVVYKDMNYNLASKVLMSATYYELDALEVLSSFFESYRIYLNRNKKVSKKRKAMHSNFIKYLKALINNSINKKKIVALRARLKEEKLVVNKTWLLSKMDERLTQ